MVESAIRYCDLSTGRAVSLAPPGSVVASSAALGWHPRAVAERQRLSPQSRPEHGILGHRAFVNIGAPVTFAWGPPRRRAGGVLPTGGLHAQPHGAADAPAWTEPMDIVSLAFDPAWLEAQAAPRPRGGPPLRERRNVPDPALLALSLALAEELAAPFPDPLRGEALLIAAAARLLEEHGAGAAPRGEALSPARARLALEAVEAWLPGRPTVAALAAAVGLSEARFARGFKARFGVPPHRYVLGRRVARARAPLARGAPPAEAAAACGFADQAHLTHAVRKATGETPGRLRRVP